MINECGPKYLDKDVIVKAEEEEEEKKEKK